MAARKTKQKKTKDYSKFAGLMGFGVTILGYASLFRFNSLFNYIIGGGLAALVGFIAKSMATPMKGLHDTPNAKPELSADDITDDYARQVVQTGLELSEQLMNESRAINEQVFTRRLTELKENVHKLLQKVMDDSDNATHLRRINAYYLPTTIKLLQNYRVNKQQGMSYMEASASRQKLLDWLDQLTDATKKMLDKIIQADLLDDDIEMQVLDQMLRADGLANDDNADALRQSAAAAVKNARAAAPAQSIPVKNATVNTAPVKAAPASAAPELARQEAPRQADAENPVLKNPHPATASASTMQNGAPLLEMPDMPEAPDFDSWFDRKNATKQ